MASKRSPFPRISYDEAAEIIRKKGLPFEWGGDFGAPDETAVSEEFDRPVMVHRYPAAVKAFYMKPDPDRPDNAVKAAVVLAHPHPELGGTMQTKVVYHGAKGLARIGCAVLRFNFRGVGRSDGRFDKGDGEKQDFAAALDYLAARFPGTRLWAAGFSFGAWVALEVGAIDARVSTLIGIVATFEGTVDSGLVVAGFTVVLELMIVVAIALLFSAVVVTPTLAGMLTIAAFVAGRSAGYLDYFRGDDTNGAIRWAATLLYWILPHLNRLDVADQVVYGEALSLGTLALAAAYAAAYTAVLLLLSMALFQRRDLRLFLREVKAAPGRCRSAPAGPPDPCCFP